MNKIFDKKEWESFKKEFKKKYKKGYPKISENIFPKDVKLFLDGKCKCERCGIKLIKYGFSQTIMDFQHNIKKVCNMHCPRCLEKIMPKYIGEGHPLAP